MRIERTAIPDVLVIEPRVFGDARGFFYESFNRRGFALSTGLDLESVQDDHSRSARNVLRGPHYQLERVQGKLVRVTLGKIFDVAVDLRRSSATFGRWVGERLDAESKRMVRVPPGFAHGFLVPSEHAEVQYKATDYHVPEHERTLAWNDPALAIAWPLAGEPMLAEKDRRGRPLAEAETYG